ncbi:MAG: preprotein translocase subunit SecG [Gammaproteobacteria bacterium]|nr:preprotein translocase subunit SecG [Gammaproteobacteria bacterium]
MENINSILLIAQVILSICLIVLILMQHGKGADAGAAFGSGASSTVFGARGSGNFLSKATGILATLFFVVCMALAYMASHRDTPGSVVESVTSMQTETTQSISSEESDLPPSDSAQDTSTGSDLPPAE